MKEYVPDPTSHPQRESTFLTRETPSAFFSGRPLSEIVPAVPTGKTIVAATFAGTARSRRNAPGVIRQETETRPLIES